MSLKRLLTGQWSTNVQKTLAVFLVFFICSAGFLLLAHQALAIAQTVPTTESVFTGTGLPMVSLTVFILGIVRIFFALLGVIAVLLLIYGGFIWMTSQGDPTKVEKAKQIIYNTIVGLIIIFSAFAIVSFIMNFLTGMGGGGGGGGINIPGGSGDFGRSAVGAGPIESVYPRPNQVNVPINTRIAVTFKQDITISSICNDATGESGNGNGICDNNEIIKNISICEISATSPDCLDNEFNQAAYAGTRVTQANPTDWKTFIFTTDKYLGAEDEQVRIFKVVLGNGITASSTGRSVFSGYRYDSYSWSFKTNGVLDLTPPQIVEFGIYPNPDSQADGYTVDSPASAGQATITLGSIPNAYSPVSIGNPTSSPWISYINTTVLNNIAIEYAGGQVAPEFKVYFNGSINVSSSVINWKSFTFTVVSPNCVQLSNPTDWSDILGITGGSCDGNNNSLPIDGGRRINTTQGFYFEATANFPQGSQWRLWVLPENAGDVLVFNNGTEKTNFIYAFPFANPPEVISRRVVGDDGRTITTVNYYTIKTGANRNQTATNTIEVLNSILGNSIIAEASSNTITVRARNAGLNQFSFNFLSAKGDPAVSLDGGSLSGTARAVGVTVLPPGSAQDPYNNSIFRITFSEAVSPILIEQAYSVFINDAIVPASTTLINQYRTIELSGTHECGVNACGKKMYCWLDPASNPTASSVPAYIRVYAARLQYCIFGDQTHVANDWCEKFGGTCQGLVDGDNAATVASKDGGRCKAGNLYYPQSVKGVSNQADLITQGNIDDNSNDVSRFNFGIVDMANNSFNGNFNQAVNPKGALIGNAEGQSLRGAGRSSSTHYVANNHMDGFKFTYEADDETGDNFDWRFFISTQIDKTAPLIRKLSPVGNYALGNLSGEKFSQPVNFIFDRLMRFATIKPGWGYGQDRDDPEWNIRYLILRTITGSANPVGYWTSSRDVDMDGDGLADYSTTDLAHNPFDQNVTYGPLAGSGIESITQNCFLPGSGPQNAGDATVANTPSGLGPNDCRYVSGNDDTIGCVTDSALGVSQVKPTNPASYGYMNCLDIEGAIKCGTDKSCNIHSATSSDSLLGSWIITKDNSTADSDGKTGCCFGKCL